MSQSLFNPRIPIPPQLREKLVTNPVAREPGIRIGGILAPFDFVAVQVFANLGAANLDQRTDDAVRGHGADPGEPRPSWSAEDSEQHGLRLIVERVSQRDAIAGSVADQLNKKIAASAARRLFNVP